MDDVVSVELFAAAAVLATVPIALKDGSAPLVHFGRISGHKAPIHPREGVLTPIGPNHLEDQITGVALNRRAIWGRDGCQRAHQISKGDALGNLLNLLGGSTPAARPIEQADVARKFGKGGDLLIDRGRVGDDVTRDAAASDARSHWFTPAHV